MTVRPIRLAPTKFRSPSPLLQNGRTPVFKCSVQVSTVDTRARTRCSFFPIGTGSLDGINRASGVIALITAQPMPLPLPSFDSRMTFVFMLGRFMLTQFITFRPSRLARCIARMSPATFAFQSFVGRLQILPRGIPASLLSGTSGGILGPVPRPSAEGPSPAHTSGSSTRASPGLPRKVSAAPTEICA